MENLIALNLSSSKMKFAAAHFTLFSATERENLHGHNFVVTAKLYSEIQPDGLLFDYDIFKTKLAELCNDLDEKLLLPQHSPYLSFGKKEEYITVLFNQETLLFLPRDVKMLPIANISVECLAQYFLQQLLNDQILMRKNQVKKIKLRVSSSPAQFAEAKWHLGGV